MPLHDSPHPLAGRRARVTTGHYEGALVAVVDWYDRVSGRSWAESGHNDGADAYAFRSAYARIPVDDEVVLGRMHSGAALFHASELTDVADHNLSPAFEPCAVPA